VTHTCDRFINILVLSIAVSCDNPARLLQKERKKEKGRERVREGEREKEREWKETRRFVSSACCVIRVTFHRRVNSALALPGMLAGRNKRISINLIVNETGNQYATYRQIDTIVMPRFAAIPRAVLLEIHRQSTSSSPADWRVFHAAENVNHFAL